MATDRFSPQQRPSASSDGARAAQVLVVDDDPGVLLLLEETMLEAGFGVKSARSGDEAVEACANFTPDLALLDINMPNMDGIEACREIRRLCGTGFPIVMVTSVDDAMSIQSAFDAGASDFILKPINWPLFQRRMESIIAEWRHATERNEDQRRIEALQRIAPEQAMLVSRNGVVIEDLKQRSSDPRLDGVTTFPTLDELYGPEIAKRFKQCISGVLKTCRPKSLSFTIDYWGSERQCQADFQVDGRERVIVVVQSVSDEAEQVPREVYKLAFYDSTTDLANEHLFRRVAKKLCADATLNDRSLAMASVSVEGVGEGEGSFDATFAREVSVALEKFAAAGEKVIPIGEAETAGRVARGAGNEFLLLLGDVRSGDEVIEFVEQLNRKLAERSPGLSSATGVAILPSDGTQPDVLIKAARSARQEAEIRGESACFHASAASVPVINTVDYALELREALAKNQFELHYQPRIDVSTRRVTSIEALLRWNHPMRGYVGLGEILHLAKATGLIFEIGDWVLRSACEAALRWPGSRDLPRVSINLSRQELGRDDLVERVAGILEDTGLDPARLELEFTEAALLRATDPSAQLTGLKALGVGLVLDDFGTGHSSLASLKNYPIDALKIDASFVNAAPTDSSDAAICEIIVMMAHKMGLSAIAEGIESLAELELLQALGCDELQGYFIAHPMPSAELAAFLGQPAAK